MRAISCAALATLALIVTLARVDESGAKKPLGTWKRTAGDNSVTFEFKPDVLRFTLVANGNTIEAEADYGVTKDGIVFGRLSKVKKPGDDGPSEGDLFSFRMKVEKDTATISELKSAHDSPEVQQLIHGEYQKEKDK